MASLIMTIDSDQEDDKQKEVKDGDIIMETNQDAAPMVFDDSNSDGSSDAGYLKNEDGTKGNAWNFGNQLKTEKEPTKVTADATSNEDEDQEMAQDDETMPERIDRILEELDIEKPKKSEDDKEDQLPETGVINQAKLHYDKDDLVQFHELMLAKPLVKACTDLDYDHPTIIQRRVIPAILEGHDVLAHSVTGSGKTAAFLLPMLQKYLRLRQVKHQEMGKLRYLIIVPTRELAAQCHSMCQSLCKYMPASFNSLAVFGGNVMRDEKRQISFDSPDLIVGTPGRLIDHIQNTKGFTLDDVETLVLDEADRLLEMGFKDELMNIVNQCRNVKRQTLMVSATLNQDLKELATLALKKPMQFTVDKQQRNADLQNIKLTQYLVRLQFEGLKEPHKGQRRYDTVKKVKIQKKNKKRLDPNHPDFDSEEEYGKEGNDEDSSEEEKGEEEGESDMEEGESDMDGDELVSDDDQKAKKWEKPLTGRFSQMMNQKDESQYKVNKAPINEHLLKREATLIALLRRSYKNRVIIFSNEKVQCTRLAALLTIYGFKTGECHGNMEQKDRMGAVEKFQAGEIDYLIATDVIARGLDIPNVKAVINFSFPTEPKRYLHRIGRTARAGQHGVAITLCNEEERKDLKKLTRKLNQNVNTFSIKNQFVDDYFSVLKTDLNKVISQVQNEINTEKEEKETMRELLRSENMLKYKKDIESRPQKQWFQGKGRQEKTKADSKEDLVNIKNKFEGQEFVRAKVHKEKRKEQSKINQEFKKKRQIKEGVIVKEKAPEVKKAKKKKGDSAFKSDTEFDNRKKKGGASSGAQPSSKKIFKKKKHLGGKKK